MHWLALHTPFTQLVVQQSVFALHDEPPWLHCVGSEPHIPFEHCPLQQSPAAVQLVPNTPHGLLASMAPPSPLAASLPFPL
jgi:hypothetical protein